MIQTQIGVVISTIENRQLDTTSNLKEVEVWEVKKQATVALSTAETEYQAMAAAVHEAIYLRALLKDFGFPMKKQIDIGEDNKSCIKKWHNPVMHKRS